MPWKPVALRQPVSLTLGAQTHSGEMISNGCSRAAIPRPGPQFGKKRVQISKWTVTREQLSESISTRSFYCTDEKSACETGKGDFCLK